MKIRGKKGKFGKGDRIVFVRTDEITGFENKTGDIEAYEPITIFKLGVILNQIARNELLLFDRFKQRLVNQGKSLFFEDAMAEAVAMAKEEIDFADPNFIEDVKNWAKRNQIPYEEIEKELSRAFQRPLSDFIPMEEK